MRMIAQNICFYDDWASIEAMKEVGLRILAQNYIFYLIFRLGWMIAQKEI